ncbi:phosphoribosyl-dephospho-CoA transferase, partial [Stenotrophomonas maltophilia]
EGKQRLALRGALQDIQHLQPPPALDELLAGGVPADWQAALQAMLRLAPARVFGAVAWQRLSGLPSVHARS